MSRGTCRLTSLGNYGMRLRTLPRLGSRPGFCLKYDNTIIRYRTAIKADVVYNAFLRKSSDIIQPAHHA